MTADVQLGAEEITRAYQKWLASGQYLKAVSIGDAQHLAFLAGVKFGASYICKVVGEKQVCDSETDTS